VHDDELKRPERIQRDESRKTSMQLPANRNTHITDGQARRKADNNDHFDLSDAEPDQSRSRTLDIHGILEEINAGVIQDESYLWQLVRIQAKEKEIHLENLDEDDEISQIDEK
jgi:hypothetical protein